MHADDADDLDLLSNTLAQTESWSHSLEQAGTEISLSVNSDKTNFVSFIEDGANAKPLKLLDLGCIISSTESDIKIRIRKA